MNPKGVESDATSNYFSIMGLPPSGGHGPVNWPDGSNPPSYGSPAFLPGRGVEPVGPG